MKYRFIPKIFGTKYSKTWMVTQRLLFDHKNKVVFVRGIWINKRNRKSIQYKVLLGEEQEEFNIVGEIPEMPTFKGKLPEIWFK